MFQNEREGKGRLEFFQKLIRFGSGILPLGIVETDVERQLEEEILLRAPSKDVSNVRDPAFLPTLYISGKTFCMNNIFFNFEKKSLLDSSPHICHLWSFATFHLNPQFLRAHLHKLTLHDVLADITERVPK